MEMANVDNNTVIDPLLEKALKITDNYSKLISGDCTLEDLGCQELGLTYRLYLLLCETLETVGASVQNILTQILRVIDPDIVLPSKLSNFTRKVRKALEKDSSLETEIISGIYRPEAISEELEKFGVSLPSLKTGQIAEPPKDVQLQIKHALEMRKLSLSRGFSFKNVVDVLVVLVPKDDEEGPDVNVVRTQLTCVHRKQQKLLHLCRNEEWEELMNSPYKFPSKKPDNAVETERPDNRMVESLVGRLIACYQQVTTLSTEMADMAQGAQLQTAVLKTVNTQYHELKSKYTQKLSEIQGLKERVATLTPRNVTKKLKRRDQHIAHLSQTVTQQTSEIDQKEEELKHAQHHIQHLTKSLNNLKEEKLKLQKSRSYLKKKNLSMQVGAASACSSTTRSTEIAHLQNEKLQLEDQLAELFQEKKICTFKDGRYCDEVREVYMNLLAMGVPIGKVKPIVESVLQGIMHVGVDRLPGKTSASMMAIEAQVIGQAQAAEAMLESANNTLHLDGTRKRFREFGSFQVSTQSASFSLGISEMLTGDAKSFLDETMHILNEMSEVVCGPDYGEQQTVKARLLQSISNMMTDRSVVNKKYCKDLEAVRRDVFSLVHDNWDGISDEDKEKLASMNDLYCGLHVIANMATAAQGALKEMSKESGADADASSVIWQCSKALTPSGNQKSGAAEEFLSFLEGKGEKSSIASFAHNRFNILFHNGGALLYHHTHILDFLTSACPNNNKLLQAIVTNLKDSMITSQCQALGILDKIVTGPLFRLVEQKHKNIFSLNDQWLLLVEYLQENSEDPTPLLHGQPVFTDEAATITRDHLYNTLFQAPAGVELDIESTKKALKLMCSKMNILVRRQLKDQLPGGKFFAPSADLIEATKSAPLTNKISEADFSDLDRLVVKAPQKSTIAKSAVICFTRNKSAKWLQNLPTAIRRKYIAKARALAPKRKKMTFLKMKAIRVERRRLQQARLEKKSQSLEKRLKLLADLKSRVERITGILATDESVRQCLEDKSAIEAKKIMKDQILYHKLVLKSVVPETKLTQWSHEGKLYSVKELSENLLQILNANWSVGVPQDIIELNSSLRVGQPHNSEQPNVNNAITSETPTVKRKRGRKSKSKATSTSTSATASTTASRSKKQKTGVPPSAICCTTGSYVAVAFEDGKWYPGQVLQTGSEPNVFHDITYLHPSGKHAFVWPSPEDRKPTDPKYIFANLNVNLRDSRGRLWTVEDQAKVDKAYEAYAAAYF